MISDVTTKVIERELDALLGKLDATTARADTRKRLYAQLAGMLIAATRSRFPDNPYLSEPYLSKRMLEPDRPGPAASSDFPPNGADAPNPPTKSMETMMELHLVIGGPIAGHGKGLSPENTDIVGLFSDHEQAVDAWRAAAHRTVDDAEMRYLILPLHQLVQPVLESEAIAA